MSTGKGARERPSAVALLRSHVAVNAGEPRAQQEEMAAAVEEAISAARPLLVQAGTGTGKSLAYLFPVAASGARAVVATATNQLSEQLIRQDLPQVRETMAREGCEPLTFALLKGRNNYVCLAKVEEIRSLEARAPGEATEDTRDALFELEPGTEANTSMATPVRQAKQDAKVLAGLLGWAGETATGDRSEAPAVPDRVWAQVSTSSAECPGATSCPFGERCFTEQARSMARSSRVVVTNHALLAQDIRAAQAALQEGGTPSSVFGPHDVVVVDEGHDFPDSVTSALSGDVDPGGIGKYLTRVAVQAGLAGEGPVSQARADLDALVRVLEALPRGPLGDDAITEEGLDLLAALATRLLTIQGLLADEAKASLRLDRPKKAAALAVLADQAVDMARRLGQARTLPDGWARWADRDRRDDAQVLRVAPVEVGELLAVALEGRALIATSATLSVGSDFSPLARRLGFGDGRACTVLDVGSPFDYPSQGMLYVPGAGFPEPVGKDRTEHTAAVLDELTALVRAAGGRTLALFTTRAGAQRAAERLRQEFPGLDVLAHGDAPADALVRGFAADKHSVLCATMGMWQGVSVEGGSCSLVVIDKVAFAPVDDVLTAARRSSVDSQGRDGFNEVVVAQAAISLAQGVGRLIRARSDRGVAAILDPRLRSKGYGRVLLGSLPPFRVYSDRDTVTAALERLTGGMPAEMLEAKAAVRQRGGNPGSRVPRRAGQTRQMGRKNLRPRRIE